MAELQRNFLTHRDRMEKHPVQTALHGKHLSITKSNMYVYIKDGFVRIDSKCFYFQTTKFSQIRSHTNSSGKTNPYCKLSTPC